MNLKTLWILLVFVPVMSADVVATCTAGVTSVPVFATSSVSGAVGDYTLDCTGGTPTPPGGATPVDDFSAVMNVPVLNTLGWILTDGVNMTPGILESSKVVQFVGVPFNAPGSGSVVFTVENIFVNPSTEPPGFQFTEGLYVVGDTSVDIPSANQQQVVAVNAVPEPFTLVFVGLGMGAMWLRRTCR